MFGRIKMANPDSVYFLLVNGNPCFYKYLALKWKKENGKDAYDEKDLEKVAQHKFDIEQSKKNYLDKAFWWEVTEENDCFILRYYPTIANETLGHDSTHNIKTILQFLA